MKYRENVKATSDLEGENYPQHICLLLYLFFKDLKNKPLPWKDIFNPLYSIQNK